MTALEQIKLTCTVCGFSFQPRRGFPADVWHEFDREGRLPATCVLSCSNCAAEGHSGRSVHFIDYPPELE